MGPLHKEQQQQPPSFQSEAEPSRTKTIRFGDEQDDDDHDARAVTVAVHSYDPGDAPNEELWFTEQEYVDIKTKSRNDAREWRRQGYSVLLQDVYSLHSKNGATDAQQDFVTTFVQLDGHLHRRGLERYCCRQHGEDRSVSKERARDAVFMTQYRAQQDALRNNGGGGSSNSTAQVAAAAAAERIAAAYAIECREAKIFARRLGKADELVALEIPTDNKKCMVVDSIQLLGSARRSSRGAPPRRMMSNLSLHSNASVDSRQVAAQRHHQHALLLASSNSNNNNNNNNNTTKNSRQPQQPKSPQKTSRSSSNSSRSSSSSRQYHHPACPKSPDSTMEELYYAAIA